MRREFFKNRVLLLIMIALITKSPLHAQNRREAYILKYRDIAVEHMAHFGIPASITLAQACLESGYGESTLAKKGNNHFGIKCHDWSGARIYHDDDKRGECFRKYDRAEDSFKDHANFLRYRERYSALFNLEVTDYKGWAKGLKDAGYATDPSYSKKLIEVIERHSLFQYDSMAGSLPTTPDNLLALYNYDPPSSSSLYSISIGRTLYQRGGVACIVAQQGDSYNLIAKEFNLFSRELLRFNDLKREQPLEPGTIIYIEKKRREGRVETPLHIASGDETIREISQLYGVRAKRLSKINSFKIEETPLEGSTIKLRR